MAQLVGSLPSVREALDLIPHKLRVVARVSGSRTQQIYAEESEAHDHSGPCVKEIRGISQNDASQWPSPLVETLLEVPIGLEYQTNSGGNLNFLWPSHRCKRDFIFMQMNQVSLLGLRGWSQRTPSGSAARETKFQSLYPMGPRMDTSLAFSEPQHPHGWNRCPSGPASPSC